MWRLLWARHVEAQRPLPRLDEPTNHLDLESVDALIAGLRGFQVSDEALVHLALVHLALVHL
jgi:ATPase subunit of ABC transporter with duplicated ATPase domains